MSIMRMIYEEEEREAMRFVHHTYCGLVLNLNELSLIAEMLGHKDYAQCFEDKEDIVMYMEEFGEELGLDCECFDCDDNNKNIATYSYNFDKKRWESGSFDSTFLLIKLSKDLTLYKNMKKAIREFEELECVSLLKDLDLKTRLYKVEEVIDQESLL